jgi:hypothetical protein
MDGIIGRIIETLKQALRKMCQYAVHRLSRFAYGEQELAPPDNFTNRTPLYMRNLMNSGELFMVSRPEEATAEVKYGLHTIEFNPESGFYWKGDLYDDDLPGTATVKQVLAGAHLKTAFVHVDHPDNPDQSGVRVYRVNWCETPPVQYVRQLHSGEKIIALGSGDPLYTALVSEEGMIYVYGYTVDLGDVNLWYEQDTPRGMGLTVKRANVLNYANILLEAVEDGQSKVWWFIRAGAPSLQYYHYEVPTAPTQEALGERHVLLEWHVGQSVGPSGISFGLWARLVVTGNDEWITMYYYPGTGRWEYRLVKFMDNTGKLHDRYYFPERSRDWNLRFRGNGYSRVLNMVSAEESGNLRVGFVELSLQPTGQSYFEVQSLSKEYDGDIRSVFWGLKNDIILVNPRFEVHSNGTLRFRSTRIP